MKNLRTYLWVAFLSLLGAPCGHAFAQTPPQTLHLVANENAVEQAIAAKLIQDIYAKAGLHADIEPLPGKRSNHAALNGLKDGEIARISPYAANNPPLIRVDPPYYRLTTGVFVRAGSQILIQRKEDLAQFRVGVVRGIAHAEHAVTGLSGVTVVSKYEQLYRMIEAGRIDVGIDTGINGKAEIHRLGLDSKVKHIGDIATFDLHNILTPKHAGLSPKIGATIKAMQASGELQELTKKYERQAIDHSENRLGLSR